MCGIALVADRGAGDMSMLDALAVMHQDLAGRGPDGEGWLLVDADLRPRRFDRAPEPADLGARPLRVATAFRRLAIRDLRREAGQPIARRSRGLWICHNGEIYNDASLRRELATHGVVFETGSDAETALAAYDVWGEACFERFRGMWAIVILDLTRGRLILCRDRLGIKPLFHASDGTRLLVASHPRTIARALRGGAGIDAARWSRFLQGLPSDNADETFFAGVRALPAGTWESIDLRGTPESRRVRHRYWSLAACVPDPADRRDARTREAELLELLESATREHLIGDRPVGVLLSGGLDSSVVTCLAARQMGVDGRDADLSSSAEGRPPLSGAATSFSIVYDDPRMSEWPYIQSVAAHAGIAAVTHRLTAGEAWSLVDDVIAAQGEPLLGQDAIAHYRAFELAREHGCVVALEGQGADELLAGLPMYEAVMFDEWRQRGDWRRVLSEARLRAAAQQRSIWSVLREYALAPAVRRRLGVRRREPWIAAHAAPEAVASTASVFESPCEQGLAEHSSDPSRLNRHLFTEVRHTNLPAVLALQDRSAMAHGVENRPPFLDHRIVEWAFRLPAAGKVGNGRRKRVLWDVAQRLLPPMVLARTDKRAIVSRADWMPLRTAHRDALAAMADSGRLRQAPGISRDRMTRFVHAYLRGEHDAAQAVWRLYTGWRWLEQCRPSA